MRRSLLCSRHLQSTSVLQLCIALVEHCISRIAMSSTVHCRCGSLQLCSRATHYSNSGALPRWCALMLLQHNGGTLAPFCHNVRSSTLSLPELPPFSAALKHCSSFVTAAVGHHSTVAAFQQLSMQQLKRLQQLSGTADAASQQSSVQQIKRLQRLACSSSRNCSAEESRPTSQSRPPASPRCPLPEVDGAWHEVTGRFRAKLAGCIQG